jgi:hypothetical protein
MLVSTGRAPGVLRQVRVDVDHGNHSKILLRIIQA